METLKQILRAAPEIALFASLFLGCALGKVKIKGFSLGGVAGSLIIALIIGQLDVTLPDALKAVCFALFIYAVGFKSGPEFFGGLNRSSFKLVLSSVVQCVAALVALLVIARVCGFGKGFAAGIGAGALTATAMMGTAGDALTRLGLPAAQVEQLTANMAVGFAITYVFGTIGVIIFVRSVAPRLLGVDMKKAARELEVELSEGGEVMRPGYITPFVPVVGRAFEVEKGKAANLTVAKLTKEFERASVERVLRDGEIIEPAPDLVLKTGDIVGLAGKLGAVVAAGELIGSEVESKEALSFSMEVSTVVVTNKKVIGKKLRQVRNDIGMKNLEGVYLVSFKRQGLPMPILANTQVRRGDVIELAGRPGEVERVAAMVGYAESSGGKSDLAYHAFAIVVGTLLGLMSVRVGGIPVTLGVGGGVLVAGLGFGWLHTRYPVFGAMPQASQWILSEFGLSAFAAVIGLSAGSKAVAAIQQQGVALLIAGAVVTIVPMVVALYFGRYVLKLNPVVLLGALCGGQTVAAALSAVNEETESMTPVLGFTVTYAISNVLLAVFGPVIVAFTNETMNPQELQLSVMFNVSAVFFFALTGALAARRLGYDIIGVFVLAFATGLGGGLIRDSLLHGTGPVAALTDQRFIMAVLAATVFGLFRFSARIESFNKVVAVLDAVGLGAFAAVGTDRALRMELHWLAAIFVGVVNAVGGGLLRDLLTRTEPLLLQPGQFYALAAVIGAFTYATLTLHWDMTTFHAALYATLATVVFRILAITFNWQNPRRGNAARQPLKTFMTTLMSKN